MDAATTTFHRLQGIAQRMRGSVPDSEDLVQDVWLRWHAAKKGRVNNAEAWLVTATTRLSIDRLRSARARREQYVALRLAEPALSKRPATPADIEELDFPLVD